MIQRRYVKLFLSTILCGSVWINRAQSSERLGGEGLPLPPILNSSDQKGTELLVDKNRDIHPTKKPLGELSTQFKNGDILFIRSTSAQSKALEEVTGSKWTHVGILFRVKEKRNSLELLSSDSKLGEWRVFEAGPKVRFHPVDKFVGNKAFAVFRLKKSIDEREASALFTVALTRVGKPYDVYFLLSNDGVTKDIPEYCSELVWYTYSKALGIVLGYRVSMASQKLDGPEAQKLIKERLTRKEAPFSVEKWKEQYVIPPESQFLSPLLERID